MAMSELNQRRWRNFRRNKRAFWSLMIFSVIFVLSLFAELIANDKPIVVSYKGALDLGSDRLRVYLEAAFPDGSIHLEPLGPFLVSTPKRPIPPLPEGGHALIGRLGRGGGLGMSEMRALRSQYDRSMQT